MYQPDYEQNNKLGLGGKIVIGLIIGGLLALIIFVFVGGAYFTGQDYQTIETLATQLKVDGFSVVDGYTDSPAVIQTTHNFTEFSQLAKDYDVSVIYQLYKSPPTFFFVTNSTYGCEYKP